MEILIKFFRDNGYPNKIIYKYIRNFLDNIYQPKAPVSTVPKLDFYCKLPYIGDSIMQLDKELRSCLAKLYPHINFKFIFNNDFTIQR